MDAYPTDDRALDALHPFTKEEEATAEFVRQRDYEDLIALLRASGLAPLFFSIGLGAFPDDVRGAVVDYAEQYGVRQALRVVSDVLR